MTDPRAQQDHPLARLGFRYREGALRRWNNFEDINLIPYSWTTSVHYIQSLDERDRTVTLTAPSNDAIGYHDPHLQYKRCYVENFREGLDAAGEWYLDRRSGFHQLRIHLQRSIPSLDSRRINSACQLPVL